MDGVRRDPIADLRRIAFLLERANEATYRVRAFRSAADVLAGLDPDELRTRAATGSLTELSGVGEVTARCVAESIAGTQPEYLTRLLAADVPGLPDEVDPELHAAATTLRAALRGDCHLHSNWSDGGSSIEEMALAAVELGHEYMVLTDHSPRLTVARGLTAGRLRQQLDRVAELNAALPTGFRILTGIEVDILADGSLDQTDELLAEVDVVVGSVHSDLRADRAAMTRRMLTAVADPHLDILGHCTGRRLVPDARSSGRQGTGQRAGKAAGTGDRAHRGRGTRPESEFDAAAVFAACAELDKAVEINCRPDRLDPPRRLLRLAVEAGCRFAIDTDAHAPGQLDWQHYGCTRAAECGVDPATVVNTWAADQLLIWAGSHAG